MGEVWLARTTHTDVPRLCALKLLRDDVTSDREAIARFADEVRIGILLQHKNIASVLDFGRVGDRHYLAMDFIDGVDLRSIVQALVGQQVVLPRPVALAIADDLLAGLAAAHAAVDPATGALLHVVHRDVSPHNVLMGVDGIARVIDFGLALSTLKREKTERDVVLGKIAYMAPEQAAGDRAAPAADVYAAAIVVTELLTGQRFYGARTGVELYCTVVAGGFVPPGLASLGHSARSFSARCRRRHQRVRLLRRWRPSCAQHHRGRRVPRWRRGWRRRGPRRRRAQRPVWRARRRSTIAPRL